METDEDEVLYGINAPARNIPELLIATVSLTNSLQEEIIERASIFSTHFDTYGEKNPLSVISFDSIDLEWFNVSQPLNFEKHFGSHIVILDFFTYCCINCLHILPDLEALEEKYQPNNSPVIVVGVHSGKFENERLTKCVADAVKRNHISHPVANDTSCKLWHELGISCWPTLLIVGPAGLPLFVLAGEGNKDYLFEFVEESIKYFGKLGMLDSKKLPLMPHLHLPSKESDLFYPGKVCTYPLGLVIADSGNHRIVLASLEGEVQKIIGIGSRGFQDGDLKTTSFSNPQGVVYHPSGAIFVADTDNHAIRKINLEEETVETIAGTGIQGTDKEGGRLWNEQAISSPWDLCLGHTLYANYDEAPNLLLVAMAGLHQIWGVFLTGGRWLKNSVYEEGTVVRLAGSGLEENRNTSYPIRAGFAQPSGISIQRVAETQIAFIADSESSSIRQISCDDGAVRKVTGGGIDPTDLFTFGDVDGPANVARFQHPLGVAVFGEDIYVADSYNHKIKQLKKDNKTYITSTILGVGNPGDCTSSNSNICMLNEPGGLCVSEDGKLLFIADTNNFCVKEYNIEEKILRRIDLKFSLNQNLESTSQDNTDSKQCTTMFLPPKSVQVNMRMKINLPPNVYFNPYAKQKYYLECSEGISATEREGILNIDLIIPINVDLYVQETAKIKICSKLFLCSYEGICMIKEASNVIEFFKNNNESKDSFEIDVEIKTGLQ